MSFSALFKGLSAEESKNIAKKEEAAATASSIDRTKNALSPRFGQDTIPFVQAYLAYYQMAGIGSLLANVASASLFFYFVFDLFAIIPYPPIQYIATIFVLFVVEKAKRFFSDFMWDKFCILYYTLKKTFLNAIPKIPATINFSIFAISLVGSLLGGMYVGTDFSPEAAAIKEKIAEIQAEKNQHFTNRSDGQIRWNAEKAIVKLDGKLEKLEAELAAAVASGADPNTSASDDAKRSQIRVYMILLVALLVELFFEACMGFRSYYDYRMYLFLQDRDSNASSSSSGGKSVPHPASTVNTNTDASYNIAMHHQDTNTGIVATNNADNAVATGSYRVSTDELQKYEFELQRLKQALKNVRSERGAWKAKLAKNEGRPETNNKHINRLTTEEVEILSEMVALTSFQPAAQA